MESLVYTRLENALSCPVYPTTPTQDTALPYVVYYRVATSPIATLSSAAVMNNFTLAVEIVGRSIDACRPIADTVTTTLRGTWTGIKFCQKIGDETFQEFEDGFHHLIINFSIWI